MSLLEHSKTFRPYKYLWAVEYFDESEKAHWGSFEVELQEDMNQLKSGVILPHEKNHIMQILRLFTQTDTIVAGGYSDIFIQKFKNNEIRMMLLSFASRECVHQVAYSMLLDTMGVDESEFSAFLEFKEMKEKAEFMHIQDTNTISGLGKALAQTVCNEGMSLFSAFVMLLNYQRFGKMKGTNEVVEWSIRDESLHVEGMTKLFRTYIEEHPRIVNDQFKSEIYSMFETAVLLEDKVIDLAYSMGEIEGLQADEVKTYVRYLGDRRLISLGLKPIFKVKDNPLPWLDWVLNGTSYKNFFEGRVTDYNADGMTGDWGW